MKELEGIPELPARVSKNTPESEDQHLVKRWLQDNPVTVVGPADLRGPGRPRNNAAVRGLRRPWKWQNNLGRK